MELFITKGKLLAESRVINSIIEILTLRKAQAIKMRSYNASRISQEATIRVANEVENIIKLWRAV